MQRTVKGTKFTYAKTVLNADGTMTTTLETISVPEKDPKKAYKMAAKSIGNFAILKSEQTEKLYVLDDEIFFKYAVEVEGGTEGE